MLLVVIFSHGLYALPELYTMIFEHLAANGFIVVGLYHRDGSAPIVAYPGGSEYIKFKPLPKTIKEKSEEGREFRHKQILTRVDDVRLCIDKLIELSLQHPIPSHEIDGMDYNDILAGRIDANRIYVVGHSFGGLTTAAACAVDNRIKTGVILDGYFEPLFFERFNWKKCPKMMFINSELWQWKGNLDVMQQVIDATKSVLHTVKGTMHHNFDDCCFIIQRMYKLMNKLGPIDPLKGMQTINSIIVKFLSDDKNQ